MNRLLKHTVSLAAAALLFSGAAGALAQTGEDDGVTDAIPLPEECVGAPLDQAAIDAVLTGGEPVVVLPDGIPLPLGDLADRETETAVAATIRQLVACLNANDAARAAAFFSEAGLRSFYATGAGTGTPEQTTAGTPVPRAEDQYLRLRTVTDVSVLADDRVAGFALIADPLVPGGGPQSLLFVFSDVDGVLLVDGVVGFSAIAPAGTPTP